MEGNGQPKGDEKIKKHVNRVVIDHRISDCLDRGYWS